MNKKYEKIISKQEYYFEYIGDLVAIIQKSQPEHFGVSSLVINCFNYGVMIGKSKERKRRRMGKVKYKHR
ncbi:hypothetical protein ACJDU8_18925 [Clostridium sp. WILCCON 0269]|uniref:Uncharacterized protein n=1 Tax=Candidatus Clostridium eludens TaxID=3381663 RepID=A0ABW8SNH1_9CLOT